ncbi:uncharacterized protein TNCV_4818261 [Trichonephila clavipes]|nr:uncharacterized protein TNCV_4818261 [Trichonephila clavipes]
MLNSRPLVPLSSDLDDLNVLTPSHFLIGRSITSIVEPDLTNLNENRQGRESFEDDKSSGRPQTSHTAQNIGKVSGAVPKNRFQTIAQIAESVGISLTTCQWILTKDLHMHKVCQHIVPCILNKDQKSIRTEMAEVLTSPVDKDSSVLVELLLETRN